jgi:hypothetical protein
MTVPAAVAVATTFVWVGLVVGISFIEAPLKFRAPGVTLPIGLGIGRLVFKAVNGCEVVFGVLVVAALTAGIGDRVAAVGLMVAVAVLGVQLLAVRPTLSRRSDAILAGDEVPRSRAHHVFIALEVAKLVALLFGGIAAIASF